MADRTRWKIETRWIADDVALHVSKAHGVPRHDAEVLAKEIDELLDHDVFYTELVELD